MGSAFFFSSREAYSTPPQYLQNLASGSCPSAPQSGQAWVETLLIWLRYISTVTMPVGTAMMA